MRDSEATVPGSSTSPRRRLRIRVRGIVQGVGFRPHIHRLAHSLRLAGEVRNDDEGVLIEVEGDPGDIDPFLVRLQTEVPPLARVDGVEVSELEPSGESGFVIVGSDPGRGASTPVTPDAATCPACLAELFDPADRRYRYPFINCTDCGPRFTIVTDTPYDRPLTTMAGFVMCDACRSEYEDPSSRRFHAQPNACPRCGPRLRLRPGGGGDRWGGEGDAAAAAAELLVRGALVAVKGIGGYHLACRADDEAAVARLRGSKRREEKPFAVMVRDLGSAAALAEVDADVARLLVSPERPIVLAPRGAGAGVAPSVAPGARELGLMLPYSPVHHLLLADAAGVPLVMTSGNVSDEPIAHEDDDALERLAGIADAFLVHDRPIHMRTDDSVARVAAGGPVLLRRSRGYVPRSLALPLPAPQLLACGAHLKSTFCLADGRRAFLSHHIGDLENVETLDSFSTGIDHFLRLFRLEPGLIVHDLHPDYLSTRHGLERADRLGVPTLGVQHHHAHLAACLAEHGVAGPAVGAIYDGTGYGTDGTVWGGELLAGDLAGFTRAGHLRTVRMPGGEAAVREPWRMACAWLCQLDPDHVVAGPDGDPPAIPATLRGRVEPGRWAAVARLARTGVASPVTSSMGRLFDAVSALCGVRTAVTYEGQAAIELERAADPAERGSWELPVVAGDPVPVLDPRPVLRALLDELADGVPVPTVAARFHNTVAAGTARACATLSGVHGTDRVVVSGGVFQNALLLERVVAGLEAAGLRVLVPRQVPPNDGGVAFGQAAVAAGLAAVGGAGR